MMYYLLLGTNMGNRLQWLHFAQSQLALIGTITKSSGIYQSAAWGNIHQDAFLNRVIMLQSTLQPLELLKEIQGIEDNAGRIRNEKWGPRTLDIDILFCENQIIDLPQLKVPHPFIAQRKFTLVPLNELEPNLIHPIYNITINTLLQVCTDDAEVSLLKV